MQPFSLRRPRPGPIDPSTPANFEPADLVDLEVLPEGFRRHRLKARIGTGHEWYLRARGALLAGTPFELSWVSIEGADRPFQEGHGLTVISRIWPLWISSPVRILDVVDTPSHCAVTIDALVGHAVGGQERMSVTFEITTGAVTFEINAVSQPIGIARLANPFVRMAQARFRTNAADAMAAASRPPRRPDDDPPGLEPTPVI